MKQRLTGYLGFLMWVTCAAASSPAQDLPVWKPRLLVAASGAVWSPGGVDKDRFLASLGGSLSVIYWFDWNTQLMLSGTYAPLNTERYYWKPDTAAVFSPDIWDVKGSLLVGSLEVRRLFAADNQNFLYLGVGADYYHFGSVDGHWEIYQAGPTLSGTITEQRDPSDAFGVHVSPGLFFLFYKYLSVDVTVRFRGMYDGKDVLLWLEPAFALGVRIL